MKHNRLYTLVVAFMTTFVIINLCNAQAQKDSSTIDTFQLAYQILGKKPLDIKYNGTKYRLLCLMHTPKLLKCWGMSADLKGIFFTAKPDQSDKVGIFIPDPMHEWEEFDWRAENENLSLIKALMKTDNFHYKKIMFDNFGGEAELTVMVPNTQ